LKSKQGRFRLDIRKKFFTVGVERHWHKAGRQERGCGCLLPGSIKGQAGWGFEQPGSKREVPLPIAGGWNYLILEFPSNPNHFMILQIIFQVHQQRAFWKPFSKY